MSRESYLFIICYLSLLYIAPEAALILSLIIWVVDIIPLYIGPALVLVPWALVAMIIGNMAMGIQLIVLTIVLLVARRVIEPKVLGDSIGLAALPTVLSMYFGYVFGGVIGLILGPFVYIGFQTAKEAGLFEMTAKN
ncbi:putative PurR-regulated permease PerM [Virgibacillus natechei]|uniref:PurR-regulated permease PerM n=1 Tax=Virgibacillus natechei TaxID=1216297 RepID=A0ABS4IHQ6_9BACI|nr:putative PurR-regulated permease PerM [Virgibacillus natechei]